MRSRIRALREWHTSRGGWIYWSVWFLALVLVLTCVEVVRSQQSATPQAWLDPKNDQFVLILGNEQNLDTGVWGDVRKYRFNRDALREAVQLAFERSQ